MENFLIKIQDYRIPVLYLGAYRLLYCFLVLIFIGLPSYSWISDSFNVLFSPPAISLTRLGSGFPQHLFFQVLTFVSIIAFVLMFLGVWCKWSSILFSITCIIGHNYWYSFGKVDHLLLWLLAPAFLAFAGWGNSFTVKGNSNRNVKGGNDNAVVICAFALCIAFSMFTSGMQKVLGGWLNWDAEAVRYHFVKNYVAMGRDELMASSFLNLNNHVIWKLFDYSALILEIGFLFALCRLRFFQLFLAFGLIFHILVMLMYNIPFYSNIIAYMVFLNWESIFKTFKLKSETQHSFLIKGFFISGVLLSAYWLYFLYFNSSTFKLSGLIDIITVNQYTKTPSENAMLMMFIFAFFVLMLCIYAEINQRLSKTSTQV